jgi:hypothetical protein
VLVVSNGNSYADAVAGKRSSCKGVLAPVSKSLERGAGAAHLATNHRLVRNRGPKTVGDSQIRSRNKGGDQDNAGCQHQDFVKLEVGDETHIRMGTLNQVPDTEGAGGEQEMTRPAAAEGPQAAPAAQDIADQTAPSEIADE